MEFLGGAIRRGFEEAWGLEFVVNEGLKTQTA
jgi:hypothetical protein